jgi:hypothetical protein
LNAGDFTGEVILLEKLSRELRVARIVLQQ